MSESDVTSRTVPVRTALVMSAAGGVAMAVVLGGGMLVARAVPWGPSVDALTFAGTLKQGGAAVASQNATLDFTLKKGGAAACTLPGVSVMTDGQGAFTARLEVSKCPSPRGLFDGGDVKYGIVIATVNGAPVGQAMMPDGEVTAVPYAKYADQVGLSDCPPGYENRGGAGLMGTLCVRGVDEMVKVGSGAMAFWVDRYEASVWSDAAGLGKQHGAGGDDYPMSFPDNGQWTAALYAVSKAGVTPSRYLTWFQASEACAASGKELPTGVEWFRAGKGTIDSAQSCWIAQMNVGPRLAGMGNKCVSDWGAQDVIGNLWEWTAEWYAGVGGGNQYVNHWVQNWPMAFNKDGTWNVNAWTEVGGVAASGIPAAALRGGGWSYEERAGLFALDLTAAPSLSGSSIGFRCVVRGR